MAASVKIEPAGFALPPGPLIVVTRIDRDAIPHFDPSMEPLSDEHTFSRILREGKHAIAYIGREVSLQLCGVDIPLVENRMGKPKNPAPGTEFPHRVGLDPKSFEHLRLTPTENIGMWFKHNVPPGDLRNIRPAVVELMSERDVVDGSVRFHAVELDGSEKDHYLNRFHEYEERVAERRAKEAQAQVAE